jgi:hypothetical protein
VEEFYVIRRANRRDDLPSTARTYDFVGFWMPHVV